MTPITYRMNLDDLTLMAEAACLLDEYKDTFAHGDARQRIVAMVTRVHDAVERAAGPAAAIIYPDDEAGGCLDYTMVKRFFAEKLASDFAGHGRFESAFYHTVRMVFEAGLKAGEAHNAKVSEGE